MALDGQAFSAGPESSIPRRRRNPLRILAYPFRFAYRVFKRLLAVPLRIFAYHPLSSLLVVLLAVTSGFFAYRDFQAGGLQPGSGSAYNAQVAPSAAAEDFIKGQTTFDASLMWGSFSSDFKQQLSTRGTSQQTLQQQLDQRKRAGAKVDQVQYGGGVQTSEGMRVFMYVLTMQAPNNQGSAETHYVLTVDPTDKIVNVE